MTNDDRLSPVGPLIKDLQQEISDLEWEGLAPEKMLDKIQRLKYLQEQEKLGVFYIPNF